jgi:hypothetical protein
MLRPRFSIRTFLIAAVLIGFVGIPAGHKQYLKWRQQRAGIIPVFYNDAQSIADVLREVYADRLQSGSALTPQQTVADRLSIEVEPKGNAVVVSGPKDVIREMRVLVSAIDARPTTSNQVIVPIAKPETMKESLRRVLDVAPP